VLKAKSISNSLILKFTFVLALVCPTTIQLEPAWSLSNSCQIVDKDYTHYNCVFFERNFTDQVLAGDFTRSNFRSTNLENADLSGASLDGVKSGAITGTPLALPDKWKLINGYLIGPGADLRNADLSDIDIEGADLSGALLGGVISGGIIGTPLALPVQWLFVNGYLVGPSANLAGADLSNTDLAGADLNSANLGQVNVKGANLEGVRSGGIRFDQAPLNLPEDWKWVGGFLIGPGADLSNANLKGLVLQGLNLDRVKLEGATLDDVSSGNNIGTPSSLPEDWIYSGGYLIGPRASLTGADLSGVELENAVLELVKSGGITGTPSSLPAGWGLYGGYLIGRYANLKGADLGNTNLEGVSSGGIAGPPSSLPPNWKLINGYLIGPGANLNDAYLKSAVFPKGMKSGGIIGTRMSLPTNWSFASGYLIGPGANLEGANLQSSDLEAANLVGANLVGANLEGTNLRGAQLFEANLTGANLKNSILLSVDIRSANLQDALLEGVRGIGIYGYPQNLPESWRLDSRLLIGPGANLESANLYMVGLEGLDLKNANLLGVSSGLISGTPKSLPEGWILTDGYLIGPGANLGQAELQNANLDGVKSGDIKGTPSNLPVGWYLNNGYLIGAKANLSSANLSGLNLAAVNLSGANLSGANLSGVNLSSANLHRSNLTRADLTGANLNGVNMSEAIITDVSASFILGVPSQLPAGASLRDGVLGMEQTSTPVPAVSGTAKTGQTLTATIGTWDEGTTTTIQWLRDGAAISNATSLSYLLTPNDFGRSITVKVTGTKTGYLPTTLQSLGLTALASQMPPMKLKISGVIKVGQVIKIPVAALVPGSTITIQWVLDGKSIKGATKSTYKILASQKGRKISVKVSQSKIGYLLATSTSPTATIK